MNAHSPIAAPQVAADGVLFGAWAIDYAAHLAAASECHALARDARRRVKEYAAMGRHVWAWEQHQESHRHAERARWHLEHARTLDAPAIALEIAA